MARAFFITAETGGRCGAALSDILKDISLRTDADNFYLEADDAHFPIFFNGEGGGHHPIYWGFDKEENICCMIFDFDLKELRTPEEKPEKTGIFFKKLRRGDR